MSMQLSRTELQTDRAALADTVACFARSEIAPHVTERDTAEQFARELYRRAGERGLLGLGYPEPYGARQPPTWCARCWGRRCATTAPAAASWPACYRNNIGLPPVLYYASESVRREVIPSVLSGERIAALAISQPGGGADVAALRTMARPEGDVYVPDGEKTFITPGMRADWNAVAVRTGEEGTRGAAGISMLVPGGSVDLSRTPLQKKGWHCSDTSLLRFDGGRVPARYLLGQGGASFHMIMVNFNAERFGSAAAALGLSQACFDEALTRARRRKTFGSALGEQQVIRHKLVEMQMRIHSPVVWVDAVAAQAGSGDTGPEWVAKVCMLKNHATQTMQFCADHACQILGGMGYMRGTVSERIYREAKFMMIGGGAEEIKRDRAAKLYRL